MSIDTTDKQDVAMAAGVDLDTTNDEILLAATNHDLDALRRLLGSNVGAANVQDPDTGFAPLHAAIAACEADDEDMQDADGQEGTINGAALGEESCLETVKLLFENGAIWNELDHNDETPGCVAHRLGLKAVYEAVVQAGMRAELLFNRMDAFSLLVGDDSEEEEDDEDDKIEGFEPSPAGADVPVATGNGDVHDPVEGFEPTPNPSKESTNEEDDSSVPTLVQVNEHGEVIQPTELANPDVNSADYLASDLEYSGDRLVDSDKNAVMMEWETEIMTKSVEKMVPASGLKTMNVGYGMGIIDGAFLAKNPAMHHIIEAHPQVHKRMREHGMYDKPNVTVHEGRWQDVLPKLLEEGVVLDGIYFDTFAEDYKDLKMFFQDYVIALLDGKGTFGFFNGLGADRQVCYDVYTRIVEMDLFDAGMDTEWMDIQIPDLDVKEEWKGVRHKYWVGVNPYKLPTCKFIG